MWCDSVVVLALMSPIYPGVPGTMHEGRCVLISFDPARRWTVDTNLPCSVLCPRWRTGPTTSGLVLSKLDSPGGDVAGHSSEGLMIQTRLCWGGASRAEEEGWTGSIRLCWDLSLSGSKPAVSCSTNIIRTQIHVLDIALFNRSATTLQHMPGSSKTRFAPYISV